MASFYGDNSNATQGWEVHQGTEDNGTDEGRDYAYVAVPEYCPCTRPCCSKPRVGWREHTSAPRFYVDEHDDYGHAEEMAHEWIEGVQENIDQQEEQYYEENHYAIAQMERYEMWRNEY